MTARTPSGRRRPRPDRIPRGRAHRSSHPAHRRPASGGAPPSSTRSTCAASPTATATAPATWRACARGSATCATSASTRSGSRPGTPSPLADGGYDVSDYRAIHPDFGTLARGRAARAGGPGPRHPDHHRRRPEPRQRSARLVPGRARRRPRQPRARAVLVPRRRRPGRRRDARTTGCRPFAGRDLDPHHEPRRHARPVVPAPVHARAARPQLEPPRRAPRARGHPEVLVRPRRRRRAHRLGRPAHQGPRARRGARDPGPGEHPSQDRDELHDVYRAWRAVADSYPGTRVLVGEIWLPDVDRFVAYLRPDELHTAFNFDFLARPVVGAGAPREHRPDPHRARAGAGAEHLGAEQPRRDAARHALRARRLELRVPQQALRHVLRPRASAPAARAPPPC